MKKYLYSFGLMLSALFLNACGGNADNLKETEAAPDFTLKDAYGKSYTLSSFTGKNPVVLYFYPKASTSGCTKQACGIRDNWKKFEEAGIAVFGISVDGQDALKKFIDEQTLNFPLLSDENKEVSKTYGVLNKLGFSNRVTFIIDKNGKIAKILRSVNVETHADDVYQIAEKLK